MSVWKLYGDHQKFMWRPSNKFLSQLDKIFSHLVRIGFQREHVFLCIVVGECTNYSVAFITNQCLWECPKIGWCSISPVKYLRRWWILTSLFLSQSFFLPVISPIYLHVNLLPLLFPHPTQSDHDLKQRICNM